MTKKEFKKLMDEKGFDYAVSRMECENGCDYIHHISECEKAARDHISDGNYAEAASMCDRLANALWGHEYFMYDPGCELKQIIDIDDLENYFDEEDDEEIL